MRWTLAALAMQLLMTPVSVWAQASVSFPDRTCDVTRYGARGTRLFTDTEAFQPAIDDCHRQGGGTVEVPRGEYLIGPIFLKSNIRLRLALYSELVGIDDQQAYRATDATRPYVTNGDW